MSFRNHLVVAALGAAIAMPFAAEAQQWPGGGPGPYGPYGARPYRAGNPYAQELNTLAVKDPARHEVCFTQANEKNLRREARWKFMIDCMKK